MDDINHSLYNDFPEYHDAIQALKTSNPDFARKAAEYHKLDHSVRGLESRNIPTSDSHFDSLKRKRLRLKDELFEMLQSI